MDDNRARALLTVERERLTGVRQAALHLLEESASGRQAALPHVDQSLADSASELGERERQQSVARRVEGELAEIDAALERLAAGSYGICERCGNPVGDDRLEALPAARLCITDQARAG